MNRKIFTLLAGAFLMLTMVFSVSAQYKPPTLAKPVDKLKLGANDYYHLVVTGWTDGTVFYQGRTTGTDSVNYTATAVLNPPSAWVNPYPSIPYFTGEDQAPYVLYIGQEQSDRSFPLFLEQLGYAGDDPTAPWYEKGWYKNDQPVKTGESATSLWCTVVNEYNQGQEVTFDFTNKFEENQMLEVEINDRLSWPTILGFSDIREYGNTGARVNNDKLVPGAISGWNLSDTYATYVQQVKPLYAYITADTVVVLCTKTIDEADIDGTNQRVDWFQELTLRIAPISAVKAGAVPGMLYFTLYEAAPFVLDALDLNSKFGTKNPGGNVTLKFNGDGSDNPFTHKDGFWAQDIDAPVISSLPWTTLYSVTNSPTTFSGVIKKFTSSTQAFDTNDSPIDNGTYNITGFGDVLGGGVTNIVQELTDAGYIFIKRGASSALPTGIDSTNLYLAVENTKYYPGNTGGEQFQTFKWRRLNNYGLTAPPTLNYTTDDFFADPSPFGLYRDSIWSDMTMFGQSIWRFVYYPSGDSIYINPYQATYLPTWSANRMMLRGVGSTNGIVGSTLKWEDQLTQADEFYTFRAHEGNLGDGLQIAIGGTNDFTTHSDEYSVARLSYGQDGSIPNVPRFYRYYHHNYVTVQDLSTQSIVTLGNGAGIGDHSINTQINFGLYAECTPNATPDSRTTVEPDLYLIRNARGEYLHIPLYSAMDSAAWVILEPDVHPELLPSFQWVVTKRYLNSASSQITLTNREFDGTQFEFIQLYKDKMVNGFVGIPYIYHWNQKEVNHKVVDFSKLKDTDDATFIRLDDKKYKNNPRLGYTYIPREEAQVNVYALRFGSGIDWGRYVSWKGDYWAYPNTDTTIYVTAQTDYDKLYFKLDTTDYASAINKLRPYGYKPVDEGHKDYIADLKRLERQPYRLNFEEPRKLICGNYYSILNGPQGEYIMGTVDGGNYYKYLGTPIFNLRHFYHKEVDGELVPYFALVQRLDLTYAGTTGAAGMTNFYNYLASAYSPSVESAVRFIIGSSNTGRRHTDNGYMETGVFVAQVDDQMNTLKAQVRLDNSTRVSTFRLEKDTDPIYRRFNVKDVDDDTVNDAPKVLDFHAMDYRQFKLFENTGQWAGQKAYWENYGTPANPTPGKKNYLGYINTDQYKDASTAIYLDTAYINRPNGDVKPQYMLVVDPQFEDPTMSCDEYGNPITTGDRYLRGRFLLNATDSARGVAASKATNTVDMNSIRTVANVQVGRDYLWDTQWERLVFTEAIHSYTKDAVYLIAGVDMTPYLYPNSNVVDMDKLDAAAQTPGDPLSATKSIRKFALNNHFHKDIVFQMRLIERGSNEFIIESETGEQDLNKNNVNKSRIWGYSYAAANSNGPVIAPCAGGWLKLQNGTMVISRSDVLDGMNQALRMNTVRTTKDPVANEKVTAAAPSVIGGTGAVTILNAAGKQVTISNILGQVVASAVLTSDNATIAAPKGVVIVAIQGETAVKTLVK